MQRSPHLVVSDLQSVVAALTELKPAAIVIDIQPLVARLDFSSQTMVSAAVELSRQLTDEIPNLSIIFATNSSSAGLKELREPPVRIIGDARKPWRVSDMTLARRPMVVFGDQILLDRLLAARVHGHLLHWEQAGRTTLWPRLQAMIGRLVAPLVFKRMHWTSASCP